MENFPLKQFGTFKSNTDFKNIFLICILWIFIVILVNPLGNFPLNDDWAYGWAVKTLVETGKFQLSDWTATNLISQVLWGTLFCLPFGFSFTALRLSTLTLGLIGVITTYGLLKEVKASYNISLMGALIVALNPIYFSLSNSFMSDVPSFTFAILALYFLIRGLKINSRCNILIGISLSLISILNRQSNLIILPAFGFAYLSKKGLTIRNIIEAFYPTLLGTSIYIFYSQWLHSTGRTPLLYNFQTKQILQSFSRSFRDIILTYSENLLIFSAYLGLFLFPLLIINFTVQYKNSSKIKKKVSLSTIIFIFTLGIAYCLSTRQQMPLLGNVINHFGLGNVNTFFLQPISMTMISLAWKKITIIGLIGAALLFQYVLITIFQLLNRKQKIELHKKWLLILTLSTIFMYFLPIGALNKGYWFDRYIIFLLPFFMMLVLMTNTKVSKKLFSPWVVCISLVILLFYGGFTISATHDYLSLNRARWQALNNLMQEYQVTPEEINGGFEFNGWYFGNSLKTCNLDFLKSGKKTNVHLSDFTCLWGQGNYQYTVSSVPENLYEVEKQYSFRRWLPWREEKLFVLRKIIY